MEKSNIKVAFCPEHGLQFFDAQSRTCEHIPREENSMEYLQKMFKNLEEVKDPYFTLEKVKELMSEAGWAGFKEGLGEAKSDPLAGYSNLTAAISAGEPIDWERLDGLVAKCVHPTLGNLLYPLEVDGNGRKVIWKNEGNFWFTTNGGSVWAEALSAAWHGQKGWTLWVEGEIPMRRKTADQLEPGHFFTGVLSGTTSESLMCVAGGICHGKHVRYAFDFMPSQHPASKWEVIEECGTFQKPEGK